MEDDEQQDRRMPTSGVIREVSGRTEGLPPLHRMTIDMNNGTVFEIAHLPGAGAIKRTARALAEIPARHFGCCPICGSTVDLTKEHVPQRQLGGQVMTSTCKPCNNGLGSRVEADLTDWYDDALPRVTFTAEGVDGRRHAGRATVRQTPQGEFVVIPDKVDAEILATFRPGAEFEMNWTQDLTAYRTAALKHAYLAACLCLGAIPDTSSAERIRRDLIAARDTPARAPLPASAEASRLQIYRTYGARTGPGLGLHAAPREDGELPAS